MNTIFVNNPETHVGAELARDDVGTLNIDASRPTAFASKPAPTGDLAVSRDLGFTWNQNCGRGAT